MTEHAAFVPEVHRLHGGGPIVQKDASHRWENRVTFNPACAFVNDRAELEAIIPTLPFDDATKRLLGSQAGLCFLLYRAQGTPTPERDYSHSSIGLAVLSPELELLARYNEPVILPDLDYENLGVEDARITKVRDRYYMFYTAYGSHAERNRIRIALASTKNFSTWEKHGLLNADFNRLDNKNAMLLEGELDGRYVMLHRPMEGMHAMAIHWATSADLIGPWTDNGLLMTPIPNPSFKDTWIGGGAPPILLDDGRYLVLYHIGNRAPDGSREYDLGLAIADFRKPGIIVKRVEPLIRPTTDAERKGDAELGVNNVVFICGAYFHRGDLYFPYAGADSVVLGGKILKKDIDRLAGRAF